MKLQNRDPSYFKNSFNLVEAMSYPRVGSYLSPFNVAMQPGSFFPAFFWKGHFRLLVGLGKMLVIIYNYSIAIGY